MSKEYNLHPDISKADFLNLLEHLKDDATAEFRPHAKDYALHDCPKNKAMALFYAGQMSLLTNMLWALSGTAQEEGCIPTISITDVNDL